MVDEAQGHRALAARFFNEVWQLLDRSQRSAAEDLHMIHLAHASRLHWQFAGGAREWAIGEWQVARVHAVLGQGEAALRHARAALDLAESGALGAFLAGSAHEGMARALRVAGRREEATAHRQAAMDWLARVSDDQDRQVLLADLAG
jgi:hypothetical protein